MKTCGGGLLVFCMAAVSFAQDITDWGPRPGGQEGFDRTRLGRMSAETATLTGTVIAPDGKPEQDVVVQLRDFANRVVASTHTNTAGVFSFDMLPRGTYELVADRESASIHQRVEVQDGFSAVTLRFDTSAGAVSSQNGLVSIAELKVPQRARDAYMKAEQAIVKHRPSDVSKYLEKSLEVYPAYAPALTLRGIVSLDKNDLAAAVGDFEKAIHSDSAYATAYSGLAAAFNKLKKYDDALRSGERASSLSPNAWQPYFEMAKAYAAKADHQRALQQLTHAQGLIAKDYPPLHLLRAGILLGLNSYEEAATELRLFLKIAPNDPNAPVARQALAQLAAIPASGAATPQRAR